MSSLNDIANLMLTNVTILSHITGYGMLSDVVFAPFRAKLEEIYQAYKKLTSSMAETLGEVDNPPLVAFTEWLNKLKMFLKKEPHLEQAFINDCYFRFSLNSVSSLHYVDDAVLIVRGPDGVSSYTYSRLVPLSPTEEGTFNAHLAAVAADSSVPLVIPERRLDSSFYLHLSTFIQAQVWDGILLNLLRTCCKGHAGREILPHGSGYQAIHHLIEHFTRDLASAQANLKASGEALLKQLKSATGDISTILSSLARNVIDQRLLSVSVPNSQVFSDILTNAPAFLKMEGRAFLHSHFFNLSASPAFKQDDNLLLQQTIKFVSGYVASYLRQFRPDALMDPPTLPVITPCGKCGGKHPTANCWKGLICAHEGCGKPHPTELHCPVCSRGHLPGKFRRRSGPPRGGGRPTDASSTPSPSAPPVPPSPVSPRMDHLLFIVPHVFPVLVSSDPSTDAPPLLLVDSAPSTHRRLYLDTGCGLHCTSDRSILHDVTPLASQRQAVGAGGSVSFTHQGTIQGIVDCCSTVSTLDHPAVPTTMRFTDVHLSDNLPANIVLLSFRLLHQKGCSLHITGGPPNSAGIVGYLRSASDYIYPLRFDDSMGLYYFDVALRG